MRRAIALACVAACLSAAAQDADPGGRYEQRIADLVLAPRGAEVERVGLNPRLHEGDAALYFDEDPEGLYAPFALEVALRRLLGFDALEVRVDEETGVLLARTSPGGRGRLDRQLAWLRAVERQRVEVRLRAYLLEAWPGAELRPGAALSPEAARALASQRPWAELEVSLPDGVRVAGVALRRELAFLGDYEVNQTGVVPVLNPQRSVFREGLWAALRLSRMPAEARAVLEFDLGFARHEGAEQVEFRPGLPLVLPRWSELAAEGSCVVTGARTLVLAAVQDTDGAGDGRALVITAEVGALPPALAPPDEAVVLRRYAWGALDRPRRDAADSGLSLDEGGPWSSDQRRERIAEALPGAVDPERWSDESFVTQWTSGLVVCQAGATQRRVAEHLQASWAQRQRTVGHWLQVVRAGGEPRARLAVAACEGWPGSIAWQRKQACLSEVERSAGAVSVRFRDPGDDPLVKTFAHGLTLEVQGVEVGGSLRVHVDLRRRALEAGQERVRTPWGELTRPVEGWSWRVEESVRQGRGPALAGEVRAPGAPTLQVRLDSRMEGSK